MNEYRMVERKSARSKDRKVWDLYDMHGQQVLEIVAQEPNGVTVFDGEGRALGTVERGEVMATI